MQNKWYTVAAIFYSMMKASMLPANTEEAPLVVVSSEMRRPVAEPAS